MIESYIGNSETLKECFVRNNFFVYFNRECTIFFRGGGGGEGFDTSLAIKGFLLDRIYS